MAQKMKRKKREIVVRRVGYWLFSRILNASREEEMDAGREREEMIERNRGEIGIE